MGESEFICICGAITSDYVGSQCNKCKRLYCKKCKCEICDIKKIIKDLRQIIRDYKNQIKVLNIKQKEYIDKCDLEYKKECNCKYCKMLITINEFQNNIDEINFDLSLHKADLRKALKNKNLKHA